MTKRRVQQVPAIFLQLARELSVLFSDEAATAWLHDIRKTLRLKGWPERPLSVVLFEKDGVKFIADCREPPPRLHIGPFSTRGDAASWVKTNLWPGVWLLITAHENDSACTPDACVCTPDIFIQPGTADSHISAQKETDRWTDRPEAKRGWS